MRDDCYPQQLNSVNEYKVIKQKFSDEVLKKHLQGLITVGSFQIDPKTNMVKWICFDFDGELEQEFEKSRTLYMRLVKKGYKPLLEFSGRRGYHVWLFIEATDASIAKKFAHEIASGIEVSEIFPKQEKIAQTGFGGQVKLPLGLHRVSNKKSYLLDRNFKALNTEESLLVLHKIFNNKPDKINITTLKSF